MFINLLKKKRNHDQSEVGWGGPRFGKAFCRRRSGEGTGREAAGEGSIFGSPRQGGSDVQSPLCRTHGCAAGSEGSQGARREPWGEGQKTAHVQFGQGGRKQTFSYILGRVSIWGSKLVLCNKMKMCIAFDLSAHIRNFSYGSTLESEQTSKYKALQ